jgi:hypothetical protein
MGSEERIESKAMTTHTPDGRDELNLAEFPLSALSHRLQSDQKTVQFEDQIRDDCRGEMITRRLTITGSDAFGLPRALDDEVLLGLLQLTKLGGFADRKVPFTRYQLIRLLGWRNETKSYERVEVSLNRWTGVTLYYRNAWWNRAKQCWMNEKFHVLDNVWLCHRPELAVVTADGDETAPGSAFVWNEVLFQSFRAGNLKAIDFQFFKQLQSVIAKRLYRFLDKRFFLRDLWEFSLKELAWEHVGLARNYDTASLKRKLRPAIIELEQKGFLEPLPDAGRFSKVRAGEWKVIFGNAKEAARGTSLKPASPELDGLETALTTRGVSPATARALIGQYPPRQIQAQLEVFDWMLERQDRKLSRNPPGFLVSAIKGNYGPPRDFISAAELARQRRDSAARKEQLAARKQARWEKSRNEQLELDRQVENYLQGLSPEERIRTEREAFTHAPILQRKLITGGGSVAAAARKAALNDHILKLLR